MRKFILLFLVLVLSASVFASNIVSDDYEINAYHTGLAGEDNEDAAYGWIFTLPYQQSFTDFAENSLFELIPGWFTDVEEPTEEITPISGPTGGGGGLSLAPECIYIWDCTNWFPSNCPVDEIQERLCINRGTCRGTEERPAQTRGCEYKPFEPLFDIFLAINQEYKETYAGETIKANVKIENFGKLELLDAFMTYWIVDENNNLVAELKDARSVTNELAYDFEMFIPSDVLSGTYKLYAQITYAGNKTAVAGESFTITVKPIAEAPKISIGYVVPSLIILILLVVIIIILVSRRKEKDKTELINTLEDYIRKGISQGYPQEQLRNLLIQHGYNYKDIDEAMNHIKDNSQNTSSETKL